MKHLFLAAMLFPALACAQTQPTLFGYYDINGLYYGSQSDLDTHNPYMLPNVAVLESDNNVFYIAPNGGPWLDSAVVWNDPAPQITLEMQMALRLNSRDSVFADTLAAHNARILASLTAADLPQRTSVTTNSAGEATWTFPNEFDFAPIVTATALDNTAGTMVTVKVTAISTTSVSVQVDKAAVVMGVLTMAGTPGATAVHLTAIAP